MVECWVWQIHVSSRRYFNMSPCVLFKMILSSETFITDLTIKRLNPGMDTFMSCQFFVTCKFLFTVVIIANERTLT